jgi:hypothetical protein
VSASVYHIQLRHFPHNMCRFNLAEAELRVTLLEPWTRDRLVELGERKWDPQRASLTVLQGPSLPPGQLTMGRGWRTAERRCRDVTEEMLVATRESLAGAGGGADMNALGAADSLGLELLSRIGSEVVPLHRAWDLAGKRHPQEPASASLALAEHAVASLLRARLIVLLRRGSADGEPGEVGEHDIREALATSASWMVGGEQAEVWVRRV